MSLARIAGAGAAEDWDLVVKRLLPHLAYDLEAVAALRREGNLVGALPRPPAPALVASDLEAREPWFALARPAGFSPQPCDARLAAAPPERLRGLFLAMSEALAALHEASDADGEPLGLVHGDLKPSHLIIDRFGRSEPLAGEEGSREFMIYVIDYGNARTRGTPPLPEPTGTPAYFAPERLAGAPPSQAADVHALGAIMWEVATNRRLRETATADLAPALAHLGAASAPILAALAPSPSGRPSARALAAALAACHVEARP